MELWQLEDAKDIKEQDGGWGHVLWLMVEVLQEQIMQSRVEGDVDGTYGICGWKSETLTEIT